MNTLFIKQTVHTGGVNIPANGAYMTNLPPQTNSIPKGYKYFGFNIRQADAANGWIYHIFCPDENYKLVLFNRYTSDYIQRYAIDYFFIKNNAL